MASAGILLKSHSDIQALDALSRQRWLGKLDQLTGYRGKYRLLEIPGADAAFLSNRGARDEFNFGEFTGDELGSLLDLANAFPGDYLVVWTFGSIVSTRTVATAGEIAVEEYPFRIDAPAGTRPAKKTQQFLQRLADSPFQADTDRLRAALDDDSLSVPEFFRALGFAGAIGAGRDPSTATRWQEFETAAKQLLGGRSIAAESVRAINATISESAGDDDDGTKLRSRPEKTPGATARRLESVRYELAEAIGDPGDEQWKLRHRAAGFYWDITDCEGSAARLTYGTDEDRGWGASASLGRLLGHYPERLMRDGLFFARAAAEAESANGHSYVESLYELAECCETAGFTLVTFPAGLQEKFREHFGIAPFEEPVAADPMGSAEAFIDLEGTDEGDEILTEIQAWMADQKAGGFTVRASATAPPQLLAYHQGKPVRTLDVDVTPVDEDALAKAAQALWPRGCFAALDLPDLLEPGEWQEGAYSGMFTDAQLQYESEMRAKTRSVLGAGSEPESVSSFAQLATRFPRGLSGGERHEEVLFLSVETPAAAPGSFVSDLRNDFAGRGMIKDYGDYWLHDGQTLFAYTRSHLATPMLIRCLADLPTGTRLRIDSGHDRIHDLILAAPEAAAYGLAMLPEPCDDEGDDDDDWEEDEEEEEIDIDLMSIFGEQHAPLLPEHPDLFGIEVDCPLVKTIVHKTDRRLFYQLDLSEEKIRHAEPIAEYSDALEAAGFAALGDLVCSQFNNVIMRGFRHPEGTCFATIMMPLLGAPSFEFYTGFTAGKSLTTKTGRSAPSHPETGTIAVTAEADATLRDVLELHLKSVGTEQSGGSAITQAGADLGALAEAVDEFLARTYDPLTG